jgi:hypothetical protein
MQYEVPQFSEVQTKVVGPLTLRQFFYIGGAGTLAYLCYKMLSWVLAVSLGLPIIGLGFAFAYLKVQGMTFEQLILKASKFLFRPKFYTWSKEIPKQKGVKYDASEEEE